MRRAVIGLALALAAASHGVRAETLGIVLIEDRSPARAAAARRGEEGFRLGIDYATQGSRRVRGREIVLRVLDDRGNPARAARLLAEGDRGGVALAVGAGGSAATLAMLAVAARL